jgi:PPE-repeat protein
MNKTTKTMITGAAMAGLLGGAFASQARANSGSGQTSVSNPGSLAMGDDSVVGKHDCKGKNNCKGLGGCKTSSNGCKSKNDCKRQGGCNTNKSA